MIEVGHLVGLNLNDDVVYIVEIKVIKPKNRRSKNESN